MSTLDLFTSAEGEPSRSPAAADGPDVVSELLESLNEPQREACQHETGPLLILAGPGSGKTRVITSRIVWLIKQRGVHPRELLAITFTNKAAREMRERVERVLPDQRGLWISTFHSMCARILRREIEVLEGYTRDFSIYDTGDRNQLVKRLIREAGFDLTRFRPAQVGAWISDAKNGAYREERYDPLADPSAGIEDEVFERVRKRYEETMRANNALDFDDLLLKVLEIFDGHLGVRDAYARRFRYVMVDEYQDTNRVQYLLTRHFASGHGNLAVCGDPDQSIYAWRGADIRNILDFEADFGAPRTVKLEQNYRSRGNILKAASAVIANNEARKAKDLWTESEDGERLCLIECGDEDEEGREIAMQIKGLEARGALHSDIAVFYRANFMQRALESALRLAGIPYQIVGGLEFYARREVRDLVAYLRLLVNPVDDVAFRRIVNVPTRGIGDTSLNRLTEWARDRRLSLLRASGSEEALAQIRGRARKSLAEFHALIERLEPLRDGDAGVAFDVLLAEIERERWLGEMDDGTGIVDRDENVEELRAHAEEYDRSHPEGKLRGFLEEVALVSDTDSMEDEAPKVTLMTLHSAKGLEYPYVFIAGVEEELLPHARALRETADVDQALEEERRLFYVGLTRARERVFLTRAVSRMQFGERWTSAASRFLDEIPPELIEGGAAEPASVVSEREALGEYEASDASAGLHVGDRVAHDHFGNGRIESLTGSGVNARAIVHFTHHGTKQLLLQYANLKRIEGQG